MAWLRSFVQAAICAAGLLGGLTVGTSIVFGTGLIHFGELLGTPTDFVVIIVISVSIVLGLAWLGVSAGLAVARKIAP